MSTLYKVYIGVLAERVRKEVEKKGILPGNQTSFRKKLRTIDNIYIINYLVNRQLVKRVGSLVALFVDLKAAFDSVDKGVLVEAMREKRIRAGLVERVDEALKEIRSRVGIGGKAGEDFWTVKVMKQGCPSGPLLFSVLIADLEEEMRRVKQGGVRLEDGSVYSLRQHDVISREGK